MRRLNFKWSNEMVFLIVNVFYGLGTSFLSEGYIQAYLLDMGMNVQQIGLYGTLGNVGALISYALFSFYKPKDGNYMKPMFIMALSMVILPVILALMSMAPQLSSMILLVSAFYSFALGFRCSCDYCVVPMVMPRSRYGRLSSKCGVIGSGLAAAVSALSAWLIKGGGALSGYMTIFLSAVVTLLISAWAIWLYKPMSAPEEERKAESRGKKLSLRSVWILFPHLLRGIASGGFYYFVVVSRQRVSLTPSGSSLIVTVGVVGTMIGCALFMFLEKHMRTGTITFLANIVAGVCAVLTAFNASSVLFFLLYFGYMLFNNVAAYAIPAGVVYSVPNKELPFISSMRMLMMSGGMMVCIQLFAFLLLAWPAWTVMAISAAVYAAAGLIFKIQYTDQLKT